MSHQELTEVEEQIDFLLMEAGVEEEYEELLELCNKAINTGSSFGYFGLGIMHRNPNQSLVEIDPDKSSEYIKKAADMGNIPAMLEYSRMAETPQEEAALLKIVLDSHGDSDFLNSEYEGIMSSLSEEEKEASKKLEADIIEKIAASGNAIRGYLNI